MLFSTLLSITVFSSVLALPLTSSPPIELLRRQTPELEQETDRLLFSTSMDDFLAARAAEDPAGLDYSSNGCTSSPDDPFGVKGPFTLEEKHCLINLTQFNFEPSCNRHDFGYRNYKAQSRFSDANKEKIDENFKADLFDECAKEDDMGMLADIDVSREVCEATATVYFEAVRLFGNKKRREE